MRWLYGKIIMAGADFLLFFLERKWRKQGEY